MKMVIHNGKRYRPEDAERLGIAETKTAKSKAKTTAAKTAAKKTARNKARTVEDEATGGTA